MCHQILLAVIPVWSRVLHEKRAPLASDFLAYNVVQAGSPGIHISEDGLDLGTEITYDLQRPLPTETWAEFQCRMPLHGDNQFRAFVCPLFT